jgi:hypothetical protein
METNIHGVPSSPPMKQYMVRLPGEELAFRCPGDGEHGCGCNVFHKETDPMVFICNACGTHWRGER